MLPERHTCCSELYISSFLHYLFIPTVENLARSRLAPPHCMPRMLAQYCEAWSDLGPHNSYPFPQFHQPLLTVTGKCFGHVFVIVGINLFDTVFL